MALLISAEPIYSSTCYARLEGDTLCVGNSLIERTFQWNSGMLRTLSVVDKATGLSMASNGKGPDFNIADGNAADAGLEVIEIHDGLVARVSFGIGGVRFRRDYRIYEEVPAIACDTYVKGVWDVPVAESPILDQLALNGTHWHCKVVEFHDVTDHRNNLVEEHSFISYHTRAWTGNLLFAQDAVSGFGLFLLREAPCSDMQIHGEGGDFLVKGGRFQVAGPGFAPEDILQDEWTMLYGVVTGVGGRDELSGAMALRAYQKKLVRQQDMVMMNTWGDRSRDGRLSESFCLQELDKAARLGVTVFQIDDGWQVGKSPASIVEGGSFDDIWRRAGYWEVDSAKFPNGLAPVVEKARSLGIEVGLWFNPSVQDDFADWEKDAEVLTGLWRQYGIRIFKIDGVVIPSKAAERNFRKLLDKVREESSGDVIFNMDVTNGRRIGYHWFGGYGNIFLENRYTDYGNYYPYKTLRNLWQLSRYVPAENLQIEFLNPWRNTDKYSGDDPFAPCRYSFGYLVSISFAAQPLAWLEASNLPEEAFGTGELLKKWKALAPDFHSGVILPVGDEPSGRSWTGFQSICSGKRGFLFVYREDTQESKACVQTWLPAGSRLSLKPVLGNGRRYRARVKQDGRISVRLKSKNSFCLYEYSLTP